MMKYEINSQGLILENLADRYIKRGIVTLEMDSSINRVIIVGSGSSYHSAMLGKYFFNTIAKVDATCEYASEFIDYKFKNVSQNSLYIFISQSGKSADTLSSMRKAKQNGAKVLTITNNSHSPMYRESDYRFLIGAAEEKAIGATKTFSASVLMLWIMACSLAQKKCMDISKEIKNIDKLRESIEYTINNTKKIDKIAQIISKQEGISILGYGINYPLALEAALKIKEISYINTAAYPMGEFIHGHYAVLNKNDVVLNLLNEKKQPIENKILDRISKKYEVKNLYISNFSNSETTIRVPETKSEITDLFNMIVTIQLLAYRTALILKRNVDKPKGLDKVVEEKRN